MDFLSSLFNLLLFIALILVGIALYSYNQLQGLAQAIKEKTSNVQVAISKKLSLLNQLIDVVKNFQEGEQFTHLKIALEGDATNLMRSYQQSGTVMAALQGVAERFPNLKASEQYHRLIDSIQQCETDIQNCRRDYNAAVKNYNSLCLSIPTVFVARHIGFSSAPYLEFDVSGLQDVTSLKSFQTDDGERLQRLLVEAGISVASAARNLTSHAVQAGKALSEKVKENATTRYFYMQPGGVPNGPATADELQSLYESGHIKQDYVVAQAGSGTWLPLESIPMRPTGAQPGQSA